MDIEPFWTAVTFLLFGLGLIVAEISVPGFFIAVPGGALVFMGAIGLVAPDLMFNSAWSWFLWPFAALLSTGLNLYAYRRWAPAGRHPVTMGKDSLPGQEGTATADVGASAGTVRVKGGTWSARSQEPIPAGAGVRVVRVEGVTLIVERA